ncbi:hypothetical protein ACFX1Z_018773 [Malus domestica]
MPSLLMASERYSKAAKEMANTMADFELVALKGSNISAPTSLQLEITRHEIVDLKTRFDAIQIQDLEFAVSKLRFAAKDEELIVAYNQTSIGEVVGEVSAQVGAAGGEALDDTAAKSVAIAEGVAIEQARIVYAAVGVGVELCKVVSHRVGSRMPYLQKQTSPHNH